MSYEHDKYFAKRRPGEAHHNFESRQRATNSAVVDKYSWHPQGRHGERDTIKENGVPGGTGFPRVQGSR